MRYKTFLGLLFLVGALSSAAVATPADSTVSTEAKMTTVNFVDLTRYAGLWYEAARIPNKFQKQCDHGTTAEYALREDGRISVVNRCVKQDGSVDEAEGVAKIEDVTTNAKLKVSFVSFLGWRPFWGDYWIVGLDEEYQWVVVGTPNRKYGWVLARTPTLDEATMEQVFRIVEQNGYSRGAFERSRP